MHQVKFNDFTLHAQRWKCTHFLASGWPCGICNKKFPSIPLSTVWNRFLWDTYYWQLFPFLHSFSKIGNISRRSALWALQMRTSMYWHVLYPNLQ